MYLPLVALAHVAIVNVSVDVQFLYTVTTKSCHTGGTCKATVILHTVFHASAIYSKNSVFSSIIHAIFVVHIPHHPPPAGVCVSTIDFISAGDTLLTPVSVPAVISHADICATWVLYAVSISALVWSAVALFSIVPSFVSSALVNDAVVASSTAWLLWVCIAALITQELIVILRYLQIILLILQHLSLLM